MALVRKGHRRLDIDKMCTEARERLEIERQDPTGELRRPILHAGN